MNESSQDLIKSEKDSSFNLSHISKKTWNTPDIVILKVDSTNNTPGTGVDGATPGPS
ncbi:MAG: hypothetical protein HY738_22900 [Bacteroidia bacterium]|nr:hypothetical protein [Bacteroidia bacterium]